MFYDILFDSHLSVFKHSYLDLGYSGPKQVDVLVDYFSKIRIFLNCFKQDVFQVFRVVAVVVVSSVVIQLNPHDT